MAVAVAVRAKRSFLWVAADSGGSALLSLLAMAIVARAIGPVEFGLAALIAGFIQFVNVFVEGLFHDALIQRRDIRPDHFDSAFWCVLGLGLFGAVSCWLGGAAIAHLVAEPRLPPLLGIAASSLVLTGPIGIANARLRRAMRFREAAVRGLAGRVVGGLVGIVLALTGGGVWSLILQPLAAALVTATLLYGPGADWRPGPHFAPARLRELAHYALPQSALQILWSARWQGFLSLTGLYAGVVVVGYANLAFRIVGTLLTLLSTSLQQFSLPLFARCQDDRVALTRGYDQATSIIAVTTFPLFTGLAITAQDFVPLLLGVHWQDSVLPLEILAVSTACHFSSLGNIIVLNALGRLHYALINAALCLVITLGSLALLQPLDPAIATLFWSIPTVGVAALSFGWLRHELGLSVVEQLRPLAIPFAANSVMVVWLLVLREWLLQETAPGLRLADSIGIGALVYAATLLLLDPAWCGRLLALKRGSSAPAEPPDRLAARLPD